MRAPSIFEGLGSLQFPSTSKMGRRPKGALPIRQIKIVIGQITEVFDLKDELLIDREHSIERARGLSDLAIAHIKDLPPFITMNQAIAPPDSAQMVGRSGLLTDSTAAKENHDHEVPPEEEIQPFDPSLLDGWEREWEEVSPFEC
jgi:hypothetical protein